MRDLALCRSRGNVGLWLQIDRATQQEIIFILGEKSEKLINEIMSKRKRFRRREQVDVWREQHSDMETEAKDRALALLLLGPSQIAKTAMAVGLAFKGEALVVDCQGLGDKDLPDISKFQKKKKGWVRWGEMKYTQVS